MGRSWEEVIFVQDPEKLKESFLGMARKYIELPPAKEAVEKEKGKDEEGSGDQEEEDTEEEEESEDEEVAMEKRPHTNKGIHTVVLGFERFL